MSNKRIALAIPTKCFPIKSAVTVVDLEYPYDKVPLVGDFVDISIVDDTFYPYPTHHGQEMIVLYDNRFIHCVAVEEYEDTCSGQELMINIYPIDENDDTLILIENCYKIAFITYIDKPMENS